MSDKYYFTGKKCEPYVLDYKEQEQPKPKKKAKKEVVKKQKPLVKGLKLKPFQKLDFDTYRKIYLDLTCNISFDVNAMNRKYNLKGSFNFYYDLKNDDLEAYHEWYNVMNNHVDDNNP